MGATARRHVGLDARNFRIFPTDRELSLHVMVTLRVRCIRPRQLVLSLRGWTCPVQQPDCRMLLQLASDGQVVVITERFPADVLVLSQIIYAFILH